MTLESTRVEIRLALHDLGRDAYQRLPRQRAALEAMLQILRIEQANSPRSNLRDDIKAAIRARATA
jgi:hypothetical protein